MGPLHLIGHTCVLLACTATLKTHFLVKKKGEKKAVLLFLTHFLWYLSHDGGQIQSYEKLGHPPLIISPVYVFLILF